MITLTFLLCIKMQWLSEHSCYVYDMYTPKESVLETKQAVREFAKYNYMTVAMFVIRY